MNMEQWWNGTDGGKMMYWEKNRLNHGMPQLRYHDT
jgi:hypothetical protein